MNKFHVVLLVSFLCVPWSAGAQTLSMEDIGTDGGRAYCRSSQGNVQASVRACLQEQRQAIANIRSLNSRFAAQPFFQQIALPHCSSVAGTGPGSNLAELSFCLNDEVLGYRMIQDLRRRYGSSRVDEQADLAIAATGSWAEAANRVKRQTGLKTVRRGSTT